MNTFRRLVASERPLVLPGAHDAISARLIQRAGFKAYFIGGFPLIGARLTRKTPTPVPMLLVCCGV